MSRGIICWHRLCCSASLMRYNTTKRNRFMMPAAFVGASIIFCILPVSRSAAQQRTAASSSVAIDRKTVATFVGRAKSYVKLRNQVKRKLPTLSKDSTPEQIAAHKKAFEEAVRHARAGSKPADILTAGTQEYLRRLIRTEFKGKDRGDIEETILDAETSGVPLKVNFPYPESKEFSTVPPTLLLKLPQLPQELNYRFSGRHMMLIDKDNGLILDYMINALP